jgi:hypothetical protein
MYLMPPMLSKFQLIFAPTQSKISTEELVRYLGGLFVAIGVGFFMASVLQMYFVYIAVLDYQQLKVDYRVDHRR